MKTKKSTKMQEIEQEQKEPSINFTSLNHFEDFDYFPHLADSGFGTDDKYFKKKPMKFDKFYMQILDDKGLEVWPLSTIQKNSARMDKLISTSELKPGTYLVRVSPSRNLSPIGAAQFEIEAKSFSLVPLIPLALLAIPRSRVADKVDLEIVRPKFPPKIAWMIYQTEKDGKVCKICRPHQGKRFRPFDPKLIVIGPEELGGQTHYRCRCHYDYVTVEMLERIQQLNAQYEDKIIKVAQIAKVYWAAKKVLNPLVVK